jgi:hypothetical protein
MKPKIREAGTNPDGSKLYMFHCPGCGYGHGFTVGGTRNINWTWNGSFDLPTFAPSLLCNASVPASRCHSFVRDGRIQFLSDCHHALAGQTVEIPDWES